MSSPLEKNPSDWEALKDEVDEEHVQMDIQVQDWIGKYKEKGGQIYCAAGCNNCCSQPVNAVFTEAVGIAKRLTEDQKSILQSNVKQLLEHIKGVSDLKSFDQLYRKLIGFCTFLDDNGSCSVYTERPFSCRSVLSTRESEWCGVDFETLEPIKRRDFVRELDRNVVAYPTHYVAPTIETGLRAEFTAKQKMAERFGFALWGLLPYLVWLETEWELSKVIPQGYSLAVRAVENNALNHPMLLQWGVQ